MDYKIKLVRVTNLLGGAVQVEVGDAWEILSRKEAKTLGEKLMHMAESE